MNEKIARLLERVKQKAGSLLGKIRNSSSSSFETLREVTGNNLKKLKGLKSLDKEQVSGFFKKIQESLPKDAESLQALALNSFDKIRKQKWTRYGKVLTVAACTWTVADLTALLLQDQIPEPKVVATSGSTYSDSASSGRENYDEVIRRNLFSSANRIPGENRGNPDGPAVRTTLPFNLIGTVILKDELHSLGTIEDKTATAIYPVRIGDEIPQKAKITKVEARRVTFQNLTNNRNEYVDLPEEIATTNPIITVSPGAFTRPGVKKIEQVSENRYSVPRKELESALGDINTILTQARAVPNWENGVFTCYKLFQIVPNSIFEKLGLKNGDCIVGVDGETIQDPSKAFELLTGLKDRKDLELKIKRNGKDQTHSYNIN